VEQYGPDHRLQVAADSRAVVVESLHDSIEVAWAGMARDQTLNELAADEWPDILVIKNIVKGEFEVLRAIVVKVRSGGIGSSAKRGRKDDIVEQQLRIQVMVRGEDRKSTRLNSSH